MGNSLQDQLKKAGLANAKQAARAKRAQNQKLKDQAKGTVVEDEATRLAREAQAAKVARDRELNAERQAKHQAREIQAQIVQLVELNRIEERGDQAFGFTDGAAIRTLHLRDEERAAVVAGRLTVVRLDGSPPRYELVPRPVAKKIAERDDQRVIVMNQRDTPSSDASDEYAGYEVPDDLMW